MGSMNAYLLLCVLLMQGVVFVQSNCDAEMGSGNCAGSEMTTSHVKTLSSSEISKESKSSNKTTSYGYVRTTGSDAEESYSYEAHHYYTTSSSSTYTHRSSSNTTKTVRVTVTGSPQPPPKDNIEYDVVASQSAASIDETVHVVETGAYNGLEAEAPESSEELMVSSLHRDDVLEDTSNPPIESLQESVFDFFFEEPVVFVEPVPSPSPNAEPEAVVEVPIEFYSSGSPIPIDPKQQDANPSIHPNATSHQADPCPLSPTEPETVSPPEKPELSPVPVTEPAVSLPLPSPQSSPVIEKNAESTSDSKILAKRVRDLIETGNITGLAEIVIESDDIYGLNMGFRFPDTEREEALQKTEQRTEDKDVIVLKALAQAALSSDAKEKVIQLMVVTATGPDGYNFSQHRDLVERFEEIFSDQELLHEVIAGNPQTYSKRRLHCAGCTPVHSYICAHCWPSQICGAYFWCPASKPSSKQSSKKSKTDHSKTETEIEEPTAISEPAPRSRSIEGDNERAAIKDSGDKSSNSQKTKSRKESKKKSLSTKRRGKQRNRRKAHDG